MSTRGRARIESYYRFHSRIYDATRWTFLFGRTAILDALARVGRHPARILEIGCGTGKNVLTLAKRFPEAGITGVDLSPEMLAVAKRRTARIAARVRLLQRAYDAPLAESPPFDLALFSYALSMFNPGFEAAIAAARADVAPGGLVAVVDFHDTRFGAFEWWMGVNHVRMNAQLRLLLRRSFEPVTDEVRTAYAGVWRYLLFVGRRADGAGTRVAG